MFRLASFTTRQLTNIGIKPIPLGDSFTVANYYNSQYQFDLYGAESSSAYYGAFGSLINDNIYFIYKYVDRSSSAATNISNNTTWLGMTDGVYAEFTVVSGCIDGDLPGYTRLFTIGGTDYEFYWDGYQYANRSLPLDFEQLIGQTFSLVYNPAIQIPVTPNTMLVAAYSDPGSSQNSVSYGANIDLNSTLFGRITNSAFKSVIYYHSDMSNYFNIALADGTYTGFTVSGGSIDGDTSGSGTRSTRAFTINGQVRSLEYTNGQYTYYTFDQSDTDIFNLVSLVGQTVSLLYDTAAQTGANGTTASGTLVVGESPYGQGYGVYQMGGSSSYGSIILNPPFIDTITYSTMGGPSNNTTASIMSGTYGGVVVDSTGIDGKTSISITIDGVTQTGTLQSMGGQVLLVEFTGDAFNFSSKVGQTLSISFTVSDAGGGGGSEVTASLISYPEPNGFYNSSNHSSSFPPGPYTDGMFFFQSGTDRDAFVTAAPTTVTFNDSYGGNSWTITGVSNITAVGPDAMSMSWTSTTMTGAYSGSPSLTYTSGGGSAQAYSGGPFNITSVDYMNFPTNLTVTFSSSTDAAEFALAVAQEPTMSTSAYYNNQVWNFVAGAATATGSSVLFSTLTNGQQMYNPSATNYIIGTKVTSANITLNNYYASDFYGGPGTLTFQSSSSDPTIFNTLVADGANGLASLIIYDGAQRNTNYAFEDITNVVKLNGSNDTLSMSFGSSTSFPNFGTPGIMIGSYVVIPSGSVGGGGAATTYTSGTDYSNGNSGPPGIYLMGSSGDYSVQLASQWWTTTAGYDALVALTSGGTFTITMPTTGSTSYTITLTSSWSSGSYPMATFTPSEPLSLMGGSNSVPATVTVASSGGGGGSSNTFTQSGNWDSINWMSYGAVSIMLSMNASAAFLTKLNAITDNVTSITFVDTQYGSTTFTVQHVYGQPFTAGGSVNFYTPSPPGGTSWNQITSITFN